MQLLKSGKTPYRRLKGLSGILQAWVSKKKNENVADLTIDDVNFLKLIISSELGRTRLKNPDVVSDQILFLLVGAMKIQMQVEMGNPWDVVDQSIREFLIPEKSPIQLMGLLSVATFVLVMIGHSMGYVMNERNSRDTPYYENPISQDLIDHPSNNTDGNLIRIYKSGIKEWTCLLPPAAMLQPQDRARYISFLNEGRVDGNDVNGLMNTLDHMDCLYQKTL